MRQATIRRVVPTFLLVKGCNQTANKYNLRCFNKILTILLKTHGSAKELSMETHTCKVISKIIITNRDYAVSEWLFCIKKKERDYS
jgi:hypothetical protein